MEFAKILFYTLSASWLISTVYGMCICQDKVQALWENPCGSLNQINHKDNFNGVAGEYRLVRKMAFQSMKIVYRELNLSMFEYRNEKFDKLYNDIEPLLQHHQHFVPSWLPGKGDVESLTVTGKPIKVIPKLFRALYTGLQKFAVAFEQIIKDEVNVIKERALKNIEGELSQVLCEIKISLINMDMSLPMSQQRTIMSDKERHVVDSFQRGIRDYGALKKYGEFISQFARLFQDVKNGRDAARKLRKQKKQY